MSSATSINRRRPGLQTRHPEAGLKARPTDHEPDSESGQAPAEAGFRVWHFFVLVSLIAATAAVIMAKQSTPEHLILISVAAGAAGIAAYAFYKMLAPLALADALPAEPIGDRLRADLEREKTLVLRSIKELEFDRAMGKLSQQDFDEMAGRLRSRAIGIMKQLDGGGYRAIIERDLAARMGPSTSRPPASVTGGEQPANSNTPDLKVGPTGVCVCGVQNDEDARFCKACGMKLEAA